MIRKFPVCERLACGNGVSVVLRISHGLNSDRLLVEHRRLNSFVRMTGPQVLSLFALIYVISMESINSGATGLI